MPSGPSFCSAGSRIAAALDVVDADAHPLREHGVQLRLALGARHGGRIEQQRGVRARRQLGVEAPALHLVERELGVFHELRADRRIAGGERVGARRGRRGERPLAVQGFVGRGGELEIDLGAPARAALNGYLGAIESIPARGRPAGGPHREHAHEGVAPRGPEAGPLAEARRPPEAPRAQLAHQAIAIGGRRLHQGPGGRALGGGKMVVPQHRSRERQAMARLRQHGICVLGDERCLLARGQGDHRLIAVPIGEADALPHRRAHRALGDDLGVRLAHGGRGLGAGPRGLADPRAIAATHTAEGRGQRAHVGRRLRPHGDRHLDAIVLQHDRARLAPHRDRARALHPRAPAQLEVRLLVRIEREHGPHAAARAPAFTRGDLQLEGLRRAQRVDEVHRTGVRREVDVEVQELVGPAPPERLVQGEAREHGILRRARLDGRGRISTGRRGEGHDDHRQAELRPPSTANDTTHCRRLGRCQTR
ncbi:MAG: hypothetical protein QM820_26435 [Minicystis sp.]